MSGGASLLCGSWSACRLRRSRRGWVGHRRPDDLQRPLLVCLNSSRLHPGGGAGGVVRAADLLVLAAVDGAVVLGFVLEVCAALAVGGGVFGSVVAVVVLDCMFVDIAAVVVLDCAAVDMVAVAV